MSEFFALCILSYMLLVVVWFLIEMFIFEKGVKQSVLYSLVWPYLAWKIKTGRKTIPNSFYSEGETHSEYKINHHPDDVPTPAVKKEMQDERDEGDSKTQGS